MDSLPEHVGRLAPLVGLLASDELGGERLIDFLNPRKRAEEKSHTLRNSLLIGVPIVAALVLAFLGYRQLSGLDREIDELTKANAAMEEPVKLASVSRERTERVDVFLDGDVNWLDEIRRLAQVMPPAQDMIVRSISGTIDPRSGGGTLQVAGGVIDPSMIDDLEEALRDEDHRVVGDGAKEGKQGDNYRWGYNEKITINPSTVRKLRYQALTATPAPSAPETPTDQNVIEESELGTSDATEPPSTAEEPPAEEPPAEEPPVEESPVEQSPAGDPTAVEPSAGEPDAAIPPATEPAPPDEPEPPPSDAQQPDSSEANQAVESSPAPQPADLKATEVTS